MATILVVDDSAQIRDQLKTDLSAEGYNVIEAVDGEDGLATASREQVDLVICDLNMPGMDGLTMCAQLKKLDFKAPIFMLTTQNTAALKEQAKSVGVVAWIIKPYQKDVLLKGVSRMLSKA